MSTSSLSSLAKWQSVDHLHQEEPGSLSKAEGSQSEEDEDDQDRVDTLQDKEQRGQELSGSTTVTHPQVEDPEEEKERVLLAVRAKERVQTLEHQLQEKPNEVRRSADEVNIKYRPPRQT